MSAQQILQSNSPCRLTSQCTRENEPFPPQCSNQEQVKALEKVQDLGGGGPQIINSQIGETKISKSSELPRVMCAQNLNFADDLVDDGPFMQCQDLTMNGACEQVSFDEIFQQDQYPEGTLEACSNGRFYKHSELISSSRYRTIYRGFDNESGCEVAWSVYSLENITKVDKERIIKVLEKVRQIKHQNILTCKHFLVKEKELVMITELITAGSIREYLKKIKLPRLIVIKNWCRKILEGIQYLHEMNFAHGKVTCESIYINSNNGDIKIGDLGIRAIPSYNTKYSELTQCDILRNEPKTTKFDVFCFGLSMLEMISSDMSSPQFFKYLCKIINKGDKQQIIDNIMDEKMKGFISLCLQEKPEDRATINDLLNHSFLEKSSNDHDLIQLSPELIKIINKHYRCRNTNKNTAQNGQSINESQFSKSINTSSNGFNPLYPQQQQKTKKTSGNQKKCKIAESPKNLNFNSKAQAHKEDSSSHFKHKVQQKAEKVCPSSQSVQIIPRIIKLKIKVLNNEKYMEVSFEYNLDIDTPESIVAEMKAELGLSLEELSKIKFEITNIISKVLIQIQNCGFQAIKESQNTPQSQLQNFRTRSDSNFYQQASSDFTPVSQPLQRNRVKTSAKKALAHKSTLEPIDENRPLGLEDNICGQNMTNTLENSTEKDYRNPACEKVIMLKDRCGQDRHLNQTADEMNNIENPIKCNVVSNQYNFMNSIVYRNKFDINSSLKEIVPRRRSIKNKRNFKAQPLIVDGEVQPNQNKEKVTLSQPEQSIDSVKENNDNGSEQKETEELKNLLQDLFPNYHLYYCADRSTWNPISQQNLNLNDNSFDLSLDSIDYQQIANTNIVENNTQKPFVCDEASIIMEKQKITKESSKEDTLYGQKQFENLISYHDQHPELFTDGLSSLFLERRSSLLTNTQQHQQNHQLQLLAQLSQNCNTINSLSSDSQVKSLRSGKNLAQIAAGIQEKVNDVDFSNQILRISNQEILSDKITNEMKIGNINKLIQEINSIGVVENKDSVNAIQDIFDNQTTYPLISSADEKASTYNLHTPNFVTPKLTSYIKDSNTKINGGFSTVIEYGQQQPNQVDSIIYDSPSPQMKKMKCIMPVRSSQSANQDNIFNLCVNSLTKIEKHNSNQQLGISSSNSNTQGDNGSIMNNPILNQDIESVTTPIFDNNQNKQQKQPQIQCMRSQKLQRGYKKMYKQDIIQLQKALEIIMKDDCNYPKNGGHFCKETQKQVKKYQEDEHEEATGVVGQQLWNKIMTKAISMSDVLPAQVALGQVEKFDYVSYNQVYNDGFGSGSNIEMISNATYDQQQQYRMSPQEAKKDSMIQFMGTLTRHSSHQERPFSIDSYDQADEAQ